MLKQKRPERPIPKNENGEKFFEELKLDKESDRVKPTGNLIDRQELINNVDQGLLLKILEGEE